MIYLTASESQEKSATISQKTTV